MPKTMMLCTVPCFFLIGSLLSFVTSNDQCRTEINIRVKALKGFVFKKMTVTAPHMCDVRCEREITCQSYNYLRQKNLCELNNRTKEARPENFRSDPAWFYIRRLNGRVPLGSIQKLPAQSCKEIKASEGKDTISSKYWLDLTGNGAAVLVYCDMNLEVYKNCAEIYKSGERRDGVYPVKPYNLSAFDVFCDQTTAGGGWTVFQKRLDGSVDFYLNWSDYKVGFGDLNGEFWLGNEMIHRLTTNSSNVLRVDLEDFEGNSSYAVFDMFGVMSENDTYKLILGSYSGTAGDSLSYHRNRPFTTNDRDNDNYAELNCARYRHGAWWYGACLTSNLNGIYRHINPCPRADGVIWTDWKGQYYSLKKTEMKIRPVDFGLD